jgi:hypothetical protein
LGIVVLILFVCLLFLSAVVSFTKYPVVNHPVIQSTNIMMAGQPAYPSEPIAVVGTACRFPGGASSPSKLWDLLRQPRNVLSKIPEDRFNPDQFYHQDPLHNGTSNGQSCFLMHSVILYGLNANQDTS